MDEKMCADKRMGHHSYTLFTCCRLLSHLKYVDENVLLRLLGAANVLQDNGVVDALGVRLVQVICI